MPFPSSFMAWRVRNCTLSAAAECHPGLAQLAGTLAKNPFSSLVDSTELPSGFRRSALYHEVLLMLYYLYLRVEHELLETQIPLV